jgi:phosphoheptose isomerase
MPLRIVRAPRLHFVYHATSTRSLSLSVANGADAGLNSGMAVLRLVGEEVDQVAGITDLDRIARLHIQ